MNPLLTNQYAADRNSERLARAARRNVPHSEAAEPGFVLVSATAARRPRWWHALEAGRLVHELHAGARREARVVVPDDEAGCAAC